MSTQLLFKKTKAQIERDRRLKADIVKLKRSAARISELTRMMREARKREKTS